jgi:hypothetical protein
MPHPPIRALSIGLVGLGAAGALAACTTGPTVDTSAVYADGTFEATGEYAAPSGAESIEVELTLEDDTVTAVTVTPRATSGNAAQYQGQFAGGIAAEIVGRDIDTLQVSRVAGSSLASDGFNEALAQIKAEALVP